MKSHHLDWTYAFSARLKGISVAASAFTGRVEELGRRLEDELKQGLLPYLNMPFRTELEEMLPAVLNAVAGYKHMLLLGIGGSALGARALQKAFFPAQDRPGHQGPWLWIADNIDADTLDAWMTSLDPRETVVVVISKSGGTIETMAQYFLVRRWLRKHLGQAWKEHVVLVTDAEKGELRAEARQETLASLPVPDNLGGRYSVLSAVGLLPAAFMGIDWKGLLDGAASVAAPLLNPLNEGSGMASALARHPSWHMAVWARELMEHGYDELIFFSYIPLWNYFGAWFSQLWAESLGKDGKGSMPVPAVGVTDQHSVNQMFLDGPRNKGCLFLTCDGLYKGQAFGADAPPKWNWLSDKYFGDLLQAEGLGTRMALTQNQAPLVHVAMREAGANAAGKLMGLCMSATILTGWLMDINPIDQPAVEGGKRLANARLGAPGLDDEQKALTSFLAAEGSAKALQSF
ncbi:MAG: glucose-6-phosphate isomerase [Desulfovibrio sp.]|jgi:glucose-6-phosphate isomerase|nr:glucose-6-phosphate isomerase [Desulfovibrio sp.]